MTRPNDAAYPHSGSPAWNGKGLTKREYFAAMAMSGYMARVRGEEMVTHVASACLVVADALIAELNKEIK